MRVALVHDYIKEYGGAERVLEALHEIYPDAPVFTSVYLPEFLGPHRDRFKNWNIKTSFFQHIPFNAKLISSFRLIAPFVFAGFDFSKFDVIITSSTGAYVKNIVHYRPEFISGSHPSKSEMSKQVRHDTANRHVYICYSHTPPRYLYGYATAREWKNTFIFRVLGEIANHFLRLIDFKSAQKVDYFIANSEEVVSRIRKFYRRDSTVIYPPVSIYHPEFISGSSSSKNGMVKQVRHDKEKEYYLAGGRLARAKHTDLIIETFAKLNLPLVVFGRGFASNNIKNTNKNVNIRYIGEVNDSEKFELMTNAKAYIFASEDEDFGITPVEVMSVGTPVIAYRSGGVLESVIDGKTGIFFDKLSVENLLKAIKQFNSTTIDSRVCIKQAKKFSKERFKKQIGDFVNSKLKSQNAK